jgi:hypothetical protein
MREKKKVLGLVSLAVCLGLAPVQMLAHHGTNISYDRNTSVTVKGVVTDFHYRNPHPALFIDVTDDGGNATHWTIEIAPTPYSLALNGWSKRRSDEALKPGTVVTVTMFPSRAGTPSALLRSIVNEEGEEILGGDADGGPTGARPE